MIAESPATRRSRRTRDRDRRGVVASRRLVVRRGEERDDRSLSEPRGRQVRERLPGPDRLERLHRRRPSRRRERGWRAERDRARREIDREDAGRLFLRRGRRREGEARLPGVADEPPPRARPFPQDPEAERLDLPRRELRVEADEHRQDGRVFAGLAHEARARRRQDREPVGEAGDLGRAAPLQIERDLCARVSARRRRIDPRDRDPLARPPALERLFPRDDGPRRSRSEPHERPARAPLERALRSAHVAGGVDGHEDGLGVGRRGVRPREECLLPHAHGVDVTRHPDPGRDRHGRAGRPRVRVELLPGHVDGVVTTGRARVVARGVRAGLPAWPFAVRHRRARLRRSLRSRVARARRDERQPDAVGRRNDLPPLHPSRDLRRKPAHPAVRTERRRDEVRLRPARLLGPDGERPAERRDHVDPNDVVGRASELDRVPARAPIVVDSDDRERLAAVGEVGPRADEPRLRPARRAHDEHRRVGRHRSHDARVAPRVAVRGQRNADDAPGPLGRHTDVRPHDEVTAARQERTDAPVGHADERVRVQPRRRGVLQVREGAHRERRRRAERGDPHVRRKLDALSASDAEKRGRDNERRERSHPHPPSSGSGTSIVVVVGVRSPAQHPV